MNKKKNKLGAKVKASMSFSKLMQDYPEAIEVLLEKGMHCIGCPMSMQETIKQGAEMHGIEPKELINEINKKLNKKK